MSVIKTKRVRLLDIAQEAGVSRITVAKVLHGTGGSNTRVSEKTAKKIRRIAERLNYRRNMSARSLKTNRTNLVGLIVGQVWEPMTGRLVTMFSQKFSEHGLSLQVHGEGETDPEAALRSAYERPVDAMIVMPYNSPEPDSLMAKLIKNKFPLVLLLTEKTSDVDYVTVDRVSGVFGLVEHLVNIGHRRIGCAMHRHDKEKHEGFFKAVKAFGLEYRDDWLFDIFGMYECGYKLGEQITIGKDAPTAYVMHNDLSAIGLIRALADRGIRVPQDLAVVGFNGNDVGKYTVPALTTTQVPVEKIVDKVVEYVVARLQSDDGEASLAGSLKLAVKPELVIRESCGRK